MRVFQRVHKNKGLFWASWLLAIVALLLAGIAYRVAASRLKLVVQSPITLPVPLKFFPLTINDWVGKDVPIPENIQRVAKNDDSLSRLYVNKSNKEWVNLYIAYSARPRTMLGHRPEVCYVAGGWVHDSTQPAKVISYNGRTIPCLIHRFYRPSSNYDEIVVLNFYILNGQITNDESVFSGLGWRTPNIGGDPARYVTQVQISSVLENSVRTAAKEMTDLILDFFPDENNRVKAAEFYDTISGILK